MDAALRGVDAGNSLPRVVRAVLASRGLYDDSVLEGLRDANESPYRSYALERFRVVRDAARFVGRSPADADALAAAAAPLVAPLSMARRMCGDLAERSVQIAEQCIELGRHVDAGARTMTEATIATAIESVGTNHRELRTGEHEARGDALAARRKRLDEVRAAFGPLVAARGLAPESRARAYFSRYERDGEIAAMEWLVSTASPRR